MIKLWNGGVSSANPAGTPAFVAWPAAGYVPKALVPTGNLWTLSALQPAHTWKTTIFDQSRDRSPQALAWRPAATSYAGSSAVQGARATSGLAVGYSTSTPGVCTVSGATVKFLAPGNCTITARQAGNASWAPASATRTVLVWSRAKAANVITWAQPAPAAAGRTATLTATASSKLAVGYTSASPTVCTVSGATVRHLAGGTCTVVARQGGSARVNPAVAVTRSWAVSGLKANAITWNVPTAVAVGQSVPLNPASTSRSAAFSYSASMSGMGVCKFTSAGMTIGANGTCTVTVSQAATATHAAAKLSRTFTVR